MYHQGAQPQEAPFTSIFTQRSKAAPLPCCSSSKTASKPHIKKNKVIGTDVQQEKVMTNPFAWEYFFWILYSYLIVVIHSSLYLNKDFRPSFFECPFFLLLRGEVWAPEVRDLGGIWYAHICQQVRGFLSILGGVCHYLPKTHHRLDKSFLGFLFSVASVKF